MALFNIMWEDIVALVVQELFAKLLLGRMQKLLPVHYLLHSLTPTNPLAYSFPQSTDTSRFNTTVLKKAAYEEAAGNLVAGLLGGRACKIEV